MNGLDRDDIIRMAREAGYQEDMFGFGIWDSQEFNDFADLVAAAEREACAKVCDDWSKRPDDVGGYIGRNIRARGQQENG